MSDSFVKNWAMAVTVIALVLMGVLIGQRIGPTQGPGSDADEDATTGLVQSAGERTITSNEIQEEKKSYEIPAKFTSIPSEWQTVLTENNFSGYAILFNPARQEVIIEECHHPGYFDSSIGQPIPQGQAFCSNVLWGQLQTLNEHSALVLARNGQQLELTLLLTSENGQSQLALSFPGHLMELVPGSKNDLFQAMDSTSVMIDQKRQQFEFQEAQYQQRRQQQSKTADVGDERG